MLRSGKKGIDRGVVVAFPMGKVVFASTNPPQNTTLPTARQENGCKSHHLHIVQQKIQYALCHLQPFSWLRLAHAPKRAQGLVRKNIIVGKYRGKAATAFNGRLCEMAAVPPQTILCEIARLSPAGSVVEAATSQSRWSLQAMADSVFSKNGREN